MPIPLNDLLVSLLFCFLYIKNVTATPVIEHDKGLRYEEYIIEHEISGAQAKNSALSIDLSSISVPPGCQKCTTQEMHYCLGLDLINDHCCCDKRFVETLPFIPHTCYLGTQLCRPIVGDCEEYNRLKSCCCDRYVLQKWKEKSFSGSIHSTFSCFSHIMLLVVYILYVDQRFIY